MTLSIITVTYNAQDTLPVTIQSIRDQKNVPAGAIEYIVVDGDSTDGTSKILTANQDAINHVIQELDEGLYDAMNKGLSVATGEYVWFMNAGDEIHNPFIVSRLLELIDQHDPDVLYGDTELIDKNRNTMGLKPLRPPARLTWKSFQWGMLVSHQSFIARRSIVTTYDLNYQYSSDVDWCIRALKQANTIFNTHMSLSKYLNEGLTTKNHTASLKERYRILNHHYGVIPNTLRHGVFLARHLFTKIMASMSFISLLAIVCLGLVHLTPTRALAQTLTPQPTQPFELNAHLGTVVNNTERLSVYRPLSTQIHAFPFADFTGRWAQNGIVAQANVRFDLYYDRDPDGFDVANRLYMRNDESYIGYQSDGVEVYIGRLLHHWGGPSKSALFLSDNPRTMDQFAISVGPSHLKFTLVHGILDDLGSLGNYSPDTKSDPKAINRFVSIKKTTWRPSKTLTISYKESILYSGSNATIHPRYLVPTSLFVFLADNAPRNDQINLMFGGSIDWKSSPWHIYSELMIDDVIFNRKERGITETGTFAWIGWVQRQLSHSSSFTWAGELVGYQAYNTDQAEGRYIYMGRGLATQFNDYVFSELLFSLSTPSKAVLEPYVGILWQGEQKINQPFASAYPDGQRFERVLTGVVEQTMRMGIRAALEHPTGFALATDIGFNSVSNQRHQTDTKSTSIAGSLTISYQFNY